MTARSPRGKSSTGAPRQLGNRQHHWMYGGPNCWQSQPYRFSTSTGVPPPVLRDLIERGWMWAERMETLRWMPRKGCWSGPQPGAGFRCGLTPKGLVVIEEIRDRALAELEAQRGGGTSWDG